jgi:hypothetical protein
MNLKYVSCIIDTSRDRSVGIATGYRLDGLGIGVQFPGERDFSPFHTVQTGSGANQATYTMATRGSFPGGKAAGA